MKLRVFAIVYHRILSFCGCKGYSGVRQIFVMLIEADRIPLLFGAVEFNGLDGASAIERLSANGCKTRRECNERCGTEYTSASLPCIVIG